MSDTEAVTVVQRYYAQAGMREAVLATRMEASGRLEALGLLAGMTLVPAVASAPPTPGAGQEDVPDVVWICRYPNLETRRRMRAVAESDPTFQSIRARQARHVRRFERELLGVLTPMERLDLVGQAGEG